MNIEIGQYINDGQNDLLVCAKFMYENKLYIYLLNEEKDEAFFYEMKQEGELWKFEKEKSPSQIQQLIIHFSGLKERLEELKNE